MCLCFKAEYGIWHGRVQVIKKRKLDMRVEVDPVFDGKDTGSEGIK